MLVLSRKNQERVILTNTETGETITVVVTGVQQGRVRAQIHQLANSITLGMGRY